MAFILIKFYSTTLLLLTLALMKVVHLFYLGRNICFLNFFNIIFICVIQLVFFPSAPPFELLYLYIYIYLFIFFCHHYRMECFPFSDLIIFSLSIPLCEWLTSTPFLLLVYYLFFCWIFAAALVWCLGTKFHK